MENNEKMSKDLGMTFEGVINNIWGKPPTGATFAGYYDLRNTDGKPHKALLFAICIYAHNYQKTKFNDEILEQMQEYQSLYLENNVDYEYFATTLIKLHEYLFK